MAREINPFLMFPSGAEQAMNFYISLFPGSRIEKIDHFDSAGPDAKGAVRLATLNLLGRKLEFFDSPVRHAFTFTPAVSFAVACESAEEVDRLFAGFNAWSAPFREPAARAVRAAQPKEQADG